MAISYIVSERWSPEADRLDLLNLFGAPIKEHLNNGNYIILYIVALNLIVVSLVHDFSGFIGSSGLPPKLGLDKLC